MPEGRSPIFPYAEFPGYLRSLAYMVLIHGTAGTTLPPEGRDMPFVYEFWQHRATAEVWAVKLDDGRPIGAARISGADVTAELLPHLAYRADDLPDLQKREGDFKRIDGRRVA